MDIVARLRAQRDFADDWRTTLAEEAADNIEKLRGDVAAYRKDFRSIAEALNDPRCDLTHTMAELIAELRAELAECKQDAKHRITRLRDALANLHGNCYVADAPTEMIAAEEALAAEALVAARKGEGAS